MQAAQVQESNLLTTTEWGQKNGYSVPQVKYLCAAGRLEFTRGKSGRRLIDENAKPKSIEYKGWITIKEFAILHNQSMSSVRRMIRDGKLLFKWIGSRILVWAETELIQRERLTKCWRNGTQKVIYWEAVAR